MSGLDLTFVRACFPGLNDDSVLADNAGGSVPARQVVDRVTHYLSHHMVQVGASYGRSSAAGDAVDEGKLAAAELINASVDEVIIAASSTMNVYVIAHAIAHWFERGDEIVITKIEHECNRGAWLRMADAHGLVIREWDFDPENPVLTAQGLDAVLSDKTKLVAFTQCANVVGAIHPVKELCDKIRHAGAISFVDGVAYAPHRRVDVRELGCDFYVASLYKIYGPHQSVLFGRKELLDRSRGQNHAFIGETDVPYKLQPGNVNHELTASLVGINEYLAAVHEHHGGSADDAIGDKISSAFELFASHEQTLAETLLAFLRDQPKVRIVGPASADKALRVPTIAFTVEGKEPHEIPTVLDDMGIGIRFGHFYAKRGIERLGLLESGGVVRVSLVHYNTLAEVERVITGLDRAINA
jgi:cysteine desulfurase family protein (TIGR01976 family)